MKQHLVKLIFLFFVICSNGVSAQKVGDYFEVNVEDDKELVIVNKRMTYHFARITSPDGSYKSAPVLLPRNDSKIKPELGELGIKWDGYVPLIKYEKPDEWLVFSEAEQRIVKPEDKYKDWKNSVVEIQGSSLKSFLDGNFYKDKKSSIQLQLLNMTVIPQLAADSVLQDKEITENIETIKKYATQVSNAQQNFKELEFYYTVIDSQLEFIETILQLYSEPSPVRTAITDTRDYFAYVRELIEKIAAPIGGIKVDTKVKEQLKSEFAKQLEKERAKPDFTTMIGNVVISDTGLEDKNADKIIDYNLKAIHQGYKENEKDDDRINFLIGLMLSAVENGISSYEDSILQGMPEKTEEQRKAKAKKSQRLQIAKTVVAVVGLSNQLIGAEDQEKRKEVVLKVFSDAAGSTVVYLGKYLGSSAMKKISEYASSQSFGSSFIYKEIQGVKRAGKALSYANTVGNKFLPFLNDWFFGKNLMAVNLVNGKPSVQGAISKKIQVFNEQNQKIWELSPNQVSNNIYFEADSKLNIKAYLSQQFLFDDERRSPWNLGSIAPQELWSAKIKYNNIQQKQKGMCIVKMPLSMAILAKANPSSDLTYYQYYKNSGVSMLQPLFVGNFAEGSSANIGNNELNCIDSKAYIDNPYRYSLEKFEQDNFRKFKLKSLSQPILELGDIVPQSDKSIQVQLRGYQSNLDVSNIKLIASPIGKDIIRVKPATDKQFKDIYLTEAIKLPNGDSVVDYQWRFSDIDNNFLTKKPNISHKKVNYSYDVNLKIFTQSGNIIYRTKTINPESLTLPKLSNKSVNFATLNKPFLFDVSQESSDKTCYKRMTIEWGDGKNYANSVADGDCLPSLAISKTYTTAKTFNISSIYETSDGIKQEILHKVTVVANTTPSIASFNSSEDIIVNVEKLFQFKGANLNGLTNLKVISSKGSCQPVFAQKANSFNVFCKFSEAGNQRLQVLAQGQDLGTYDVNVNPPENNSPVISSIQQEGTAKPNATVSLTANATDADGDALTYLWEVNWKGKAGSYTSSGKKLTLTLPAVDPGSEDSVTATVTVTDSKKASDSESKTVSYKQEIVRQLKFIGDDFNDGDTLARATTKRLNWTIKNSGNVPLSNVKMTPATTADKLTVTPVNLPSTIATWAVNETKTFIVDVTVPKDVKAATHAQRWNITHDGDKRINYTSGAAAYIDFTFKTDDPETLLGRLVLNSNQVATGQEVSGVVEAYSGNAPYEMTVDWGDNTGETIYKDIQPVNDRATQAISHEYSANGNYKVTAVVTDLAGETKTLQDYVNVGASNTTSWRADVHDIDTNEAEQGIPVSAAEFKQGIRTFAEYSTNWQPTVDTDSKEYFVKYRLPVPANKLTLDREFRLFATVKGSNIMAHDREFNIKTAKGYEYTASVRDVGHSESGYYRLRNLKTGKTDYALVAGLSDEAKTSAATYILNAKRDGFGLLSNNTGDALTNTSVDLSNDYVTEINVTFKGNGKLNTALLQYDFNGDGELAKEEIFVLNHQNMQVDWTKLAERQPLSLSVKVKNTFTDFLSGKLTPDISGVTDALASVKMVITDAAGQVWNYLTQSDDQGNFSVNSESADAPDIAAGQFTAQVTSSKDDLETDPVSVSGFVGMPVISTTRAKADNPRIFRFTFSDTIPSNLSIDAQGGSCIGISSNENTANTSCTFTDVKTNTLTLESNGKSIARYDIETISSETPPSLIYNYSKTYNVNELIRIEVTKQQGDVTCYTNHSVSWSDGSGSGGASSDVASCIEFPFIIESSFDSAGQYSGNIYFKDDFNQTYRDDVAFTVEELLTVSNSSLSATGIKKCGDYAYNENGSQSGHNHSNTQDCTKTIDNEGDPIPRGQDGSVQAGKTMSFSVINRNGAECVLDNVTGLIWEQKSNAGDILDMAHTYTWYNTNSGKNGGDVGLQNGGNCTDSACDTSSYIQALNNSNYCGYSDWRMPTVSELISIVDYGRAKPAINPLFTNTKSDRFWTESSSGGRANGAAWFVDFQDGSVGGFGKTEPMHIRAVRKNLLQN